MVTIKEFLENRNCREDDLNFWSNIDTEDIKQLIHLHTQQALKLALRNKNYTLVDYKTGMYRSTYDGYPLDNLKFDDDSILNAYPIESIK